MSLTFISFRCAYSSIKLLVNGPYKVTLYQDKNIFLFLFRLQWVFSRPPRHNRRETFIPLSSFHFRRQMDKLSIANTSFHQISLRWRKIPHKSTAATHAFKYDIYWQFLCIWYFGILFLREIIQHWLFRKNGEDCHQTLQANWKPLRWFIVAIVASFL